MNIFPIGTIAANSDSGTIDSISYNMFEPNGGCKSNEIDNILISAFENKTMLTRKKAEPNLSLSYTYVDIFDREYRQIAHFVKNVEGPLTSFWVVDFSMGQSPSNIADSSGDWLVSIDNTRLYSTIANQKANRVFIWDGKSSWKEGNIVALSTNTSITVNVDGSDFGNLSLANALANAWVFPMYEVYLIKDTLSNFDVTKFWNEDITISNDGGYMRSGTVNMISKYKV